MKRLLLRGLCVMFLIGIAVVLTVYCVQQQAISHAYRSSPAGLIAGAANTIAEGGHTHTFGDTLVTVLSVVGILVLIGFFVWLASPLLPLQAQRRRYQSRRYQQQRYQRPPQALQLPADQQWMLRQEIQRLEQHLQHLEQQPYQQYPESLYQEEESPWVL